MAPGEAAWAAEASDRKSLQYTKKEVDSKMANVDLTKYGITGTTEIVHNPSYEVLFQEETKAGLEGFEVGKETELGAVNVMTGIYTGRSPKDKYIVMDENSRTLYGGPPRSTRTTTIL